MSQMRHQYFAGNFLEKMKTTSSVLMKKCTLFYGKEDNTIKKQNEHLNFNNLQWGGKDK